MSAAIPCEPGHYCVEGIKYQCPAGRFGYAHALSSPQCSGECAAGYMCPSHPGAPSTRATMRECGEAKPETPSTVYCPPGMGASFRVVDLGYYTIGGHPTNRTRSSQARCPPGHYCSNGIIQPCPPGTYGLTAGLLSKKCTGVCPAGFRCPEKSIEPIRCEVGSYSTGGTSTCTPCPGGRSRLIGTQACVHKRECCGI